MSLPQAVCLLLLLQAPQDDLRQGLAALNRNDIAHARESLEKAAKAEPANGVVWAALAHTYLRAGEKDAALECAARAGQFGAQIPLVQHSLALFYDGTGDPKNAAAWETRYIATPAARPDAEGFVADLGQALLQRRNFIEALELLENGQRQFPKNAQIVLAWGVAAYAEHRPTVATGAFLRVIRLDSTVEQPYIFLGRMLDEAGDQLAQITAAYTAWEARAPGNYMPVFLHAKALLASPDADVAVIGALLRRSIQLNGAFWESHNELGKLLAGRGEWAEAERELSRSIELNPGDARTHYNLARVYLRLGKPDRAKTERSEYERLTAAENAAAPSSPGQ
jgi:Flp pilus assembly protein TadD